MEGATLPDGADQERREAHSFQGIRHLTPQTCGFSLPFPIPSGGDRAWGTFPPQISGERPNARLRWQFLSWPFLQPKGYVMASYRRASRERCEIAPPQDTTQPYIPFNSYLTTRDHKICRCLYWTGRWVTAAESLYFLCQSKLSVFCTSSYSYLHYLTSFCPLFKDIP